MSLYARSREYPAQARSARATYLIMTHGCMTTHQLMEELGYKQYASVRFMMDNISIAGIPIIEQETDVWAIMPEDFE